jgi:predicted ferric reductase
MLAVVALWVYGGGVQDLDGLEGWLTGIGRLTGLIAADLLLLQVFLMARVPFVERSYGQDELARRHRWVGFASVNLMLLHIALIVVAYAGVQLSAVVQTVVDLVTTYPGMLLATAGTALLLLVAVTSMRIARRRLRYESWHLLHLYAYLGVGLAIPHMLWTGEDFLETTWASTYWWGIYGLAAGAVIVFRVIRPLWRSFRHKLVVESVEQAADGVVSVRMSGRKLEKLPVSAGQFFVWRFMDGRGWSRANPFSLSAAPNPYELRITAQGVGDGSGRLAELRPGTRVMIEGPYGRLTSAVRTRRKVTLLAGGIGITPLRALAEELDYDPGDVTLIYRAANGDEVIFREELEQLFAERGMRLFYVVGPRLRDGSWLSVAAAGRGEAEALRQLVPDIKEHDVYICGSPTWMSAVQEAVLGAGVPKDRIHVERFAW